MHCFNALIFDDKHLVAYIKLEVPVYQHMKMTVTGSTSLFCLFQSKVEDAVALVPGMNAEEKLKSVQFWNVISGKLQEIVNNSAADINALAMKFDDSGRKVASHVGCESLNPEVSGNSYSPDYVNGNSNYVACTESSARYSNDSLNESHNRDFLPGGGAAFTSLCFTEPSCISTNLLCLGDSSRSNGQVTMAVVDNCVDSISDAVLKKNGISCSVVDRKNSGQENSSTSCDIVSQRHKAVVKTSAKSDSLGANLSEVPNLSNGYPLFHLLTSVPVIEEFREDSNAVITSDLNPIQSSNTFDAKKTSSFPSLEILENESKEPKEVEFEDSKRSSDDQKQAFVCEWCEQEFTDASAYDSHRLMHTKPFFCTECDAHFSCKGNLMVHFRKHTGEKPYNCSLCTARFSTRGNLKRHMRSHSGVRPHECTYCGSCFTEKKSLIVHTRRHTGEKPYECKVCGRKFSQSGILQSHMAVHLNERAHLCEHCGKAFRQKSQLRVHMMRHEGVRNYNCKQCTSRFLIKGDLERHKRIHTGERPFVCEICRKSFTRQQSLKEHLNRHYGIKPFHCKHCTKTFAEMSACYKHMKHHEKGNKFNNNKTEVHQNSQKVVDGNSLPISCPENVQGDGMDSENFTGIFPTPSEKEDLHNAFTAENEAISQVSSSSRDGESLTT